MGCKWRKSVRVHKFQRVGAVTDVPAACHEAVMWRCDTGHVSPDPSPSVRYGDGCTLPRQPRRERKVRAVFFAGLAAWRGGRVFAGDHACPAGARACPLRYMTLERAGEQVPRDSGVMLHGCRRIDPQISPRAAIDTGSPLPITRWSSTRTPTSCSASRNSRVIARSAWLGSATPDG